MAHRLYWEPGLDHAVVQVLTCEPLGPTGFVVTLDQDFFHPQGGGQPSDCGWINEVEVTHVGNVDGNVLHHLVGPVPVGSAFARLNTELRALHSRLHSAGHLIGSVAENYGWKPLKGHHWPGEAKVVFTAVGGGAVPSLDELTRACMTLIEQDQPLHVLVEEGFRQVGFAESQMHGCGGTHVACTGELKGLRLTGIKHSKGMLTVRYDIG